MGDSTHIDLGPGLFYVAPIGTAEPTSSSAALPSAWRAVGYTEEGTTFNFEYTNEPIEVAEEFYPVSYRTTAVQGSVSLALAEVTRQNLALALNAGAAAADDATSLEPPDPGAEVRVMGILDTESDARWIFRQMFQSGNIEMNRRKAPDKALIPVEFRLEKPTGSAPWKVYPNAAGLI